MPYPSPRSNYNVFVRFRSQRPRTAKREVLVARAEAGAVRMYGIIEKGIVLYITMDARWTEAECPECKGSAGAHGWLFNEPPPLKPHEDRRKAVGEVFQHLDGHDCVVRYGAHKHDYSIPTKKNGMDGYVCECGEFQSLGLLH